MVTESRTPVARKRNQKGTSKTSRSKMRAAVVKKRGCRQDAVSLTTTNARAARNGGWRCTELWFTASPRLLAGGATKSSVGKVTNRLLLLEYTSSCGLLKMFCFIWGFYLWCLRGAAPKLATLWQKVNWRRRGGVEISTKTAAGLLNPSPLRLLIKQKPLQKVTGT